MAHRFSPPPASIRDWLRRAETTLVSHGVPNARRNAEWMLCHSLGWNMLDVYVQANAPLLETQADHYWRLIERRASREPLQYILAETEFMSLRFEIRRKVFIPRPETELLVEKAEAWLRRWPLHEALRVIDLCSGSGIVGVSLSRRIPNLTVVAVDTSPEAVQLTAANTIHHGVADRVSVVEAPAHEFLESQGSSGFAGVVCNPPYIASGELTALPREVREHEPMLALDGGRDGLDFYRKVVPLLARCLHANGFVVFEIGDTQAAPVSALLQDAGFNAVDVAKDYAGCDRVITASRAGARHG